jgi:hypothetical protein
MRFIRGILTALILGVGLVSMSLATQAQEEAEFVPFTIYKADCPINFSGSLFDACHDRFVEGVGFEITDSDTDTMVVTTDADGYVVVDLLQGRSTASEIEITESSESFEQFLGAYVYCQDILSGDVIYDEPARDDGSIAIASLTSDQAVVCDWYNFSGPDDGVDDDLVFSLPVTGSGSTYDVDLIIALALIGSIGLIVLILAVHVRRGDLVIE